MERGRVAVVGIGLLGIRIAGELALQGCTVHVHDGDPIRLQTVHSVIQGQLQELKERGLLDHDAKPKGCVIAETLLSGAVTDAELVIEAIVEDAQAKNSLFKSIASICSKDALLCTSSISLDLEQVFAEVPHPERTLGLRHLFPVYLIKLAEVTPHSHTSPATIGKVCRFLGSVGKEPITRGTGDLPYRLTELEATQLQKSWKQIN